MAKGKQRKTDDKPMFFSAFNYRLIGVAILLIVGGFTAMYVENEVQWIYLLVHFSYRNNGRLHCCDFCHYET